ncbi:ABC transporter permease [Pseudothermotoga thermarum]|uniref:Binding-protein-dependent transport systems inner membrane component n=1 Tax=Pseudothermotoga thermarum DSM 5069 TaxID=688269 RepID=F7YTF9_9THEM|nr:iron ABC transporter permease [Pseudothermotoga thermarum]AEH51173.1 binding-protein-dependent transport systems inner membrane component [Pseudothermotoga thermarum DSM 5069]
MYIKQIKRVLNEPVLLFLIVSCWILLALFMLYPLIMVGLKSFQPRPGIFGLDVYRTIFTRRYFITPIFNTLKLGVTVASIGVLIGYLFAYSIVKVNIPLKAIFRTIAIFPIVSPPFVVALSLIMLLGRNGILTKTIFGGKAPFQIYGFWGLVIVETLAYFPTAFMTIEAVLLSIGSDLEEASMSLGSGKWRTFWTVTFPLSMPGILSAWLLVFSQSMADFGNPLILGGRFQVLSVAAYLEITGSYRISHGSALAVLLLIPNLIAFFAQRYWLSRKSYVTITGKPSSIKVLEPPWWVKMIFILICLVLIAGILLIYGTVFIGSFTKLWGVDHNFTLANYKYAFGRTTLKYLIDTLLLASVATPICGVLGILIAYLVARKEFPTRRLMEATALLGFAVPGTVFGIGYLLAFNDKPMVLTGTALIIILVFIFRELAVGVQNGVAVLYQIDKSIEEASLDLGASSGKTFWRITMPLLMPAFFNALFTAFVRSMTAISAVIFVVSARWNLLTVRILGAVENADLAQAAALSWILIAIVLLAMFLLRFLTINFSYQVKLRGIGV